MAFRHHLSDEYLNFEAGIATRVEERVSTQSGLLEYVVITWEIKAGLERWKELWSKGGTWTDDELRKIRSVRIESTPFRSGLPAFRYALESVGKDPALAQAEYEKFVDQPRPLPAFDPNYRPRRDDEKEG